MVLAQKGHKVKLFEKETGWAACMAARLYPLGKAKYPSFLVWQRTQLEKLGVEICLQTELTAEQIESDRPHIVMIATGSRPWVPPIRGIENAFVISAVDLLEGRAKADGRVAVIGGRACRRGNCKLFSFTRKSSDNLGNGGGDFKGGAGQYETILTSIV